MLSQSESREKLTKGILAFYDKLGVPLSEEKKATINGLKHLDIILCEHQFFFPLLGIYRLPLMAASEFSGSDKVVICIVNDIFFRRNHFTTRRLGIYCKGQSSSQQRKPIIIPCDKVKPLCFAPPPPISQIDNIGERIRAKYELTFKWLLDKKGIDIHHLHKAHITERITSLIKLLKQTSKLTKTYSDWCILTNIKLYQMTNPEEYKRIIFISHGALLNEFSEIMDNFVADSDKFVNLTNKIIEYQLDNNQKLYTKSFLTSNELPLWFLCPECNFRNRAITNGSGYEFECGNCKNRFLDQLDGFFYYPDIVAKQTLSAFIRPQSRIVGAIKPYSKIVDECTRQIYGLPVPDRKVLSSKPFFHGLATPKEGVCDATVLESLIEVSHQKLGSSLVTSKWDDNPIIKGDYK